MSKNLKPDEGNSEESRCLEIIRARLNPRFSGLSDDDTAAALMQQAYREGHGAGHNRASDELSPYVVDKATRRRLLEPTSRTPPRRLYDVLKAILTEVPESEKPDFRFMRNELEELAASVRYEAPEAAADEFHWSCALMRVNEGLIGDLEPWQERVRDIWVARGIGENKPTTVRTGWGTPENDLDGP